jgi:hypothetical protein
MIINPEGELFLLSIQIVSQLEFIWYILRSSASIWCITSDSKLHVDPWDSVIQHALDQCQPQFEGQVAQLMNCTILSQGDCEYIHEKNDVVHLDSKRPTVHGDTILYISCIWLLPGNWWDLKLQRNNSNARRDEQIHYLYIVMSECIDHYPALHVNVSQATRYQVLQ